MMMKLWLFFIVGLMGISCDKIDDKYTYEEEPEVDWNAAANSSTDALIQQFWNTAGYFNYGSNGANNEFQYWPNAHAMDVLIDAYQRTGNDTYAAYFNQWYEGVKTANGDTYYNNFYDDMQWNALTMLRLYEVTKEEKYLETVKTLWEDILTGWNEDYAAGGIAWLKDRLYSKNACSNGPASILAARLYRLTQDEQYKDWALKIYDWQKNTLYDRSTGAVFDNINGETNVLDRTTLTYNQGTFLGTAVELYKITGDRTYLNDAQKTANYNITKNIDQSNNILRNEGENDNALFKGIFMRYFLMLLQTEDLNEAYRTKFDTFFRHNAVTLWTKGCYAQSLLFGPAWNTPPLGEAQLTAQASAGMTIEAMAAYVK